jgi:hypothetical protein
MRARRGLFLVPTLAAVAAVAMGCSSATPSGSGPSGSGTSAPAANSGSGTSAPAATSGTASNWTLSQGGSTAPSGLLDGVDCASASSCVAVGSVPSSTGPAAALVETLDQGSWVTRHAPAAPGSQGDYLFSVSCPAVGSCVAVGYFFTPVNGGGKGTMLIDTLADGKWSVTSTPPLSSAFSDSFLNGVSCSTATNCVAVGNTDDGDASTDLPLIVTLTGTTWSVTKTPNLGSSGALQSVSCPEPTTCVATGDRSTPGSVKTLVESLSGGSWSVTSSPGSGGPNPTYGSRGLTAISCVTGSSCVAVGQLTGPGPVAGSLANGKWSVASSPNPVPTDSASGLYGVSCGAAATCVAVGVLAKKFGSTNPDGTFGLPLVPLIETGSGTTWSVAGNPSGLPADSGLHAVSCVGSSCVAVGQTGQFTSPMSTAKTLILQTR